MKLRLGLIVGMVSCILSSLSFAEIQRDCLKNSRDSRICIGDRVIDSAGYVGTVKAAFSNGQTKVLFDGYTGWESRHVDGLGKSVQCFNNSLCIENRIIDSANYSGTIMMIFDNGKAKVKFDGYSAWETRAVTDISKSVPCFGKVCESSRVIDRANYVGTVQMVTENGKAKVKFDAYSGWESRSASDLFVSVSCLRGICVSDRVIDSKNEVGTVQMIFENTKAKVKFDGYSSWETREIDQLSRMVDCP